MEKIKAHVDDSGTLLAELDSMAYMLSEVPVLRLDHVVPELVVSSIVPFVPNTLQIEVFEHTMLNNVFVVPEVKEE